MRERFMGQLALLHEQLTDMGKLCEEAIGASMRTLAGEKAAAAQTAELEQRIDRAEDAIQSLCLQILLRQQPVAGDLRTVSAALKMISDLERIGDQAADIADIARALPPNLPRNVTHLREMASAASKMVTDSVEAFVRQDAGLARRTQREDDRVDALFDEVKTELAAWIVHDPTEASQCLELLMVAKYLERIGDHAVNVAQWVEYALFRR